MRLLPLLLLGSTLMITGCSWLGFGDSEEEDTGTSGFTEKDFYEVIQGDLNARSWEIAIKNLQALEAQHPFGDYAEQAQLELIFAHFKKSDYEAAIASADRFIRLHPQHPNVDYAYYLKGLANYSQSKGFFDQLLPTDPTKRDPGAARNSFATFSELLSRFPESSYAPDARKRMIYLRNLLARHEIHAANYYFIRGAFLAAANRGRYVVENFQMTPATPDGLAVMAQAYHLMDMHELASDAVALLAANYPDHPSMDANGNFKYQKTVDSDNDGWMSTLTFGLFSKEVAPAFDSRHIYNVSYQGEKEAEPEGHSWLHWISFGLFD